MDMKPGFVGYDDELHINTQSGSQWDGLRKSTKSASIDRAYANRRRSLGTSEYRIVL